MTIYLKSLQPFHLPLYHSLVSFKTSGLLWPLPKSSALFILYPRWSDPTPVQYVQQMSPVNRLLPKASRHNFEGDAARIIFSPNEHIAPAVRTCRGSIYRTRNDGRHKCRLGTKEKAASSLALIKLPILNNPIV